MPRTFCTLTARLHGRPTSLEAFGKAALSPRTSSADSLGDTSPRGSAARVAQRAHPPRRRPAALRESRRDGDHQRALLALAPRVRASSPPAAPFGPPWICSPALFPAPVPAPPLRDIPLRFPSDSPDIAARLTLNTASPSAAPLPGFPAPKAALSLRHLRIARRLSFRLACSEKVAEPDIFK